MGVFVVSGSVMSDPISQHPDFKLLVDVINMMNSAGKDGNIDPEDPLFLAVIESVGPEEVLVEMARIRANLYTSNPPTNKHMFKPWLMAIWVDAVTTGVLFERSRRTRDG